MVEIIDNNDGTFSRVETRKIPNAEVLKKVKNEAQRRLDGYITKSDNQKLAYQNQIDSLGGNVTAKQAVQAALDGYTQRAEAYKSDLQDEITQIDSIV